MDDSPENCFARAADARAAAEAEPLENARQKHLVAAAAWDLLATNVKRLIEARKRKSEPLGSS